MEQSVPAPASLRIRLPYGTEAELIARYGRNFSPRGLFIATKTPKALGLRLRFQLVYVDGVTALEGEADVTGSTAEGARPGMELTFLRLDAAGEALLRKLFPPAPVEEDEIPIDVGGFDEEESAERFAREEAERIAREEAERIEAARIEAERIAREEAERIEAERIAREEAERIAREEAERIEAERIEAERIAREEAERVEAERIAREEAERIAREEAERIEAERIAREEAERIEAERIAREEAERIEAERVEAERIAREEAEREEAARLARVEAVRQEAERVARLEAEREEALRLAREEAAREEAARLAREEAERQDAERLAREEAERLAREEAEREEAARLAREEAARQEADRLAREEAEREEVARLAREEAEREEAARLAREEAQREEAARLAREEAQRQEADRLAREEAEREEVARLARAEAEREEAARLAREQAAREEAARLAREEAEREEAARLAQEAADRAAREEAARLAAEAAAIAARDETEALAAARHAAPENLVTVPAFTATPPAQAPARAAVSAVVAAARARTAALASRPMPAVQLPREAGIPAIDLGTSELRAVLSHAADAARLSVAPPEPAASVALRRALAGRPLPGDTHRLVRWLTDAREQLARARGASPARVAFAVPAAAGPLSRTALDAAAREAGLTTERIVGAPASSALAWAAGRSLPRVRLLVLDVGGGGLDAALVEITGDQLEVLETDADDAASGRALDDRLVASILQDFTAGGATLADGHEVQQRVRAAVTAARLAHDTQDESLVIAAWAGVREGRPCDLELPLKRSTLQEATTPLADAVVAIARGLLERRDLPVERLGAVLVGGGLGASPVLRDQLALRLGRPVEDARTLALPARGAALLCTTRPDGTSSADRVREPSTVPLVALTPAGPVRLLPAGTTLPTEKRVALAAGTGPIRLVVAEPDTERSLVVDAELPVGRAVELVLRLDRSGRVELELREERSGRSIPSTQRLEEGPPQPGTIGLAPAEGAAEPAAKGAGWKRWLGR